MPSCRPPLIGICGPIGVGKTTVLAALAGQLGLDRGLSVSTRTFFARCVADRNRWASASQVAFITAALQDTAAARQRRHGAVIDRPAEEMLGVFGTYLHARGALAEDELALLTRLVALG
jgi:deoxyadenosine/deoxycytidine kinase